MFHDLCTCLLETTAGFAKMAEPIEVPFRLYTRAGSRNPVLDGTWILPLEGALLEYIHGHFVACHGDVLDTVNICCKVAACAACSRWTRCHVTEGSGDVTSGYQYCSSLLYCMHSGNEQWHCWCWCQPTARCCCSSYSAGSDDVGCQTTCASWQQDGTAGVSAAAHCCRSWVHALSSVVSHAAAATGTLHHSARYASLSVGITVKSICTPWGRKKGTNVLLHTSTSYNSVHVILRALRFLQRQWH